MDDAVVHLSSLVGGPLLDSTGERLGRVEDLVARLDDHEQLPPVIGMKARIGGRALFVPIDRVEHLEPGAIRVTTTKLDLAQFERRAGEVLLGEDLLDRSLINVRSARLVVAHEVPLVHQYGGWRVAGVDSSLKPRLRRLLPRRLRGRGSTHGSFVPWGEIEPLAGNVPGWRATLASRLRRLHPAQLADLVEAASHDEGAQILQAVGEDKELEADVFEELDDEHRVEFLDGRSDEEVAAVLARMASDDAVDLLLELDQERRLPILGLLPATKQHKLRGLLGHNPATAGGLMNPDFTSVRDDTTVADALAQVRAGDLGPLQQSTICVVGSEGRLTGVLPLIALVRAAPTQPVGDLVDGPGPWLAPSADLPDVARTMSDYNLTALPVLDSVGRPVGVIAVDDVLELLIPEGWRRRVGLARE